MVIQKTSNLADFDDLVDLYGHSEELRNEFGFGEIEIGSESDGEENWSNGGDSSDADAEDIDFDEVSEKMPTVQKALSRQDFMQDNEEQRDKRMSKKLKWTWQSLSRELGEIVSTGGLSKRQR